MSESVVNKLVPINEYDPRVNLRPATQYAVKKGGSNETMNVFPSSSYSTSQINFLPIVPNMDTIVSRRAMIGFYYEVAITGTTDQVDMRDCLGLLIAPRANPNGNVVNTINSTINNTSISINLANNISVLQKFNVSQDEQIRDLSLFPSMNDFYQNYRDGQGANNNPLAEIGNAGGAQEPRGGWGNIEVVSSSPTSLVFRFYSIEPLYLSPWTNEESHSAGFFGVNNLTFNLVLGSLNRCISIDTLSTSPNIVVSSINTTFYRAPEVFMTYIQPSNLSELPRSIPYSYSTVQEYQTDRGLVSGGATFTMQSQNIQLDTIPKRIYLCAQRSNGTKDYSTSDVFARIDNVSVNFDVQSGLLSSASEAQLYAMSAYNGYQGSYSAWHKYTGSVLAIDFARDICLQNPLESVGLGNVKKNIQFTVTFTNLNVNPVNYTFFVIVVTDGLFTLTQGTSITQTGILTSADILDAVDTSKLDAPRPSTFYGGSFLKKALKGIKTAVKYAPRAIGTAQKAIAGDYSGAIKMAATGKGLVGGKMMTKNQLMQRRLMMGSGVSQQNIYSQPEEDDECDDCN
jgi:hypothetical protein